ncbi:DUF4097 domain-containing protein [Myxococcus sp. K15C18031901]|uniref:DUF4097 family beta strand repeat-containing protein n=1 Tax=Myxococcus dinghuensis TaxID=2906761 RepID=UPI0020A713FE|nr:DUF4097 family beta strand repeat-containing protein [Myxococcus dinghuensis]MCP3101258.1 DUF4097 domain-containing protein [Myxococcus dinghuensis]
MWLPLLAVLASAPASQNWKFETDGTPQVQVSVVDGAVRVDAVDGNNVVIEAVLENPGSGRESIEVVQKGDVIQARVCCGPCEEGNHSCKGKAPAVRMTVKVPRQAELEVSVVNAAVAVKGVAGEQEIASVNGRVEVNGSERRLSVSAVDAEVVLAPRKLGATSVSTVSGDVRLKLPDPADATVEFTSVGGRLNGKSAGMGSRNVTYGAGTQTVEVSTVSGSLTVQP